MDRDDIIRMAEEASGGRQPDGWGVMLDHEQLERFADLIAAAEREACAKVCEEYQDSVDRHKWPNGYECAAAIRARGIN